MLFLYNAKNVKKSEKWCSFKKFTCSSSFSRYQITGVETANRVIERAFKAVVLRKRLRGKKEQIIIQRDANRLLFSAPARVRNCGLHFQHKGL